MGEWEVLSKIPLLQLMHGAAACKCQALSVLSTARAYGASRGVLIHLSLHSHTRKEARRLDKIAA